MNLLLVDDDPVTLSIIMEYLNPLEGLNFATASSGREAIATLRENLPDVMILDYRLPDIDGIGVLEHFRDIPGSADVPVLMITAAEQESVMTDAMEAGASDYLQKPITPVPLLARTRNLLKLRRRTQELIAVNRQLEAMAMTDPLTGLANRRHFLDRAATELQRAQRFGHAMAVLMVDADHFKQVNDTYGHDAGDRVLCALASLLEANARRLDIIGRLGGEEFAVASLETDADSAMALAERIRGAIAETAIDIGNAVLSITVSIGLTGLQPADASVDDLLKRADAALYGAKRAGRNRVCR